LAFVPAAALRGLRFCSRFRRGRLFFWRRLAFAEQQSDARANRNFVALLHEKFVEDPIIERFHLHRRLVRLDLRKDVADFDRIASFLAPFYQRPFRHRVAELGHFDVSGHGDI
jgi:hypothetical protein